MRLIALAGIAALLAGCASSGAPQGPANVTIKNAPSATMGAALTAACISGGGRIENAGSNHLTCAAQMSDGQDFAFRLMVGGAKSDPERITQFAWGQLPDGSLSLNASEFIQYNAAFGQQRRQPLTSAENRRKLQGHLDALKSAIESKTASSGISASAGSAEAPMTKAQWRQEQLRLLQQSGVSYEEYQRRYQEIMAD